MKKCPNKSSQEWKSLVDKFGEDFAFMAYDRNGENIPSLSQAQHLLRDVLPGNSLNFNDNSAEATSTHISNNTAKKAAQNDKETKYSAVGNTLEYQKEQLIKRLSRIIDQRRGTRDKELRKQLSSKYTEVSNKIKVLEGQIDKFSKVETLEELQDTLDYMLSDATSIVNNVELSHDDITEASRIITLLQLVGDFSVEVGDSHIIFSDEELGSEALRVGFSDEDGNFHKGYTYYKEQADNLENKLNRIKEQYIIDTVRAQANNPNLTKEQIFKGIKDVNYVFKQTLDMSDVNDHMVQAMFKELALQAESARVETQERFRDFDKLWSAAKKFGSFKEVFGQQYKDGTYTGDMVTRFVPDFYDEKRTIRDKSIAEENYQEYDRWVKDNEILFNVNVLFNEDGTAKEGEQVDKHKKELIDNLGERGYNEYYEKQQSKIENYIEDKESYKELLDGVDAPAAWKEDQMKLWVLERSPFINAAKVIDNAKIDAGKGVKVSSKAYFYTISVPRKYRKSDGKLTGYYSTKFEKIENNENLMNFYTYVTDLLRDMKYIIPGDRRRFIRNNTLPDIKNKAIVSMNRGFTANVQGLIDALQKGVSNSDISSYDPDERDLKTGEKIRRAKLRVHDRQKQIDDYITLKTIEKGSVTPEDILKWKKEILSKISSEKSYDPESTLRLYVSEVVSYKYRSMAEGTLNMLFNALKNRKELNTNLASKVITGKDGTPQSKDKGLSNLIEMVDYQYGALFGEARHKVEGKIKKVFTSEEKEELDKLKGLLKKVDDALLDYSRASKEDKDEGSEEYKKLLNQRQFLENKIENIGGYLTASAIGDKAIQWYTYLGMSFNFLAGYVNLFQGFLENTVKAVDGRLFNTKDYYESFWLTIQASLPKALETDEVKKIRACNLRFDVMQSAINELYDLQSTTGLARFKKKCLLLRPLAINEITEFQNQMPIVRAYMKKLKATDADGNVISVWDAFDSDFNLKEGVTLESGKENSLALKELKIKIDALIKNTHGNYSYLSPMKGKETVMGRAIMQFRSWMPQMINQRFAPEKEDDILGITTKGRYRSYGIFFSSIEADGQVYSGAQNALYTLKQILRKATFRRTKFDERFSEVDAANMRANLQELFILLGTMASILAIRGLLPDDEESNAKFFANMLINLSSRYQSDILMYLNPSEFEKISKNTVPVLGLISNIGYWFDSSFDYLFDASNDNWDRFVKNTLRLIPGASQIPRVKTYGSKLFQ